MFNLIKHQSQIDLLYNNEIVTKNFNVEFLARKICYFNFSLTYV